MKTLFKEKTLSIVLRSILLGCPILVAPHTFAAATNYQTEEFKANWGLNSIGAHHAYEKGYTGKGVAIGVSDSDFPAGIHELINNLTFVAPNKKGKEHDASLVIGNDVTNDFDPAKYKHGAHVSGIIAGQKDNIGMHGVAYGSKLFVQNMANNIYPLIDGTSVRVINNSWGAENDAHYGIDANNPKYADLTGIDGKTQFNLRDYKEANSKNRPLEFLEKVLDKQTGITIKDAVDATTDTIFVGGVRYDVKNDKSNENGEINRIRAIQDAAKSGVINVFAAGNYNHYNEPGAYQGLPMVYEGLLPHYLTVANLISVRSDQIEIPEDSKVITTTKGYQLFEVEHQGEKYLRLVDLEEGAIDYLYKEVGSNIELTDIIVSDKATKEVLFAGSSQCGYTALWCVAAPGTGIYSSTFDKNVNNELVDNYENMTGTSMAAPHATGALAILMERFPYMTSSDVNNVLKTTTQDMDEQGAVKDGSSRVIDQYFGWGKIDLEKAIKGPAIFASSDDVKDMLADDVKQNLGNDLDRLAATFGNGDFTVNMGKGVVYDKGTPRQRTCDAKECEFDTWSNDITGSGGLIKNGSGVLQLTGTNTYKGETHINEGGLDLAGSLTSNLTINKAGILSGQGRAGNVNINDGKFIPSFYNANGLSTFTIHGDIKFTPDSTYTVKIKDESQQVDKLVVKGKAYLNKANFNMYEEKPDNLLTKNDVSRYQGNEYTLIDAEKIDQSFNDNYIKSITTDDVKPELVKAEQDKKLQLKFKDLAADKAAADKAAADKAAADKAAADKAAADKAAADKAAADKAAADKAAADKAAADKAAADKAAADKAAADKAAADKAAADKAAADKAAADKAAAEKEAKDKAEQEAKDKAEQEANDKAEQEAKDKAEQEAKDKAEQEAKDKAEQEAKDKAEQEAKDKAEQEAKDKAEQEAVDKAKPVDVARAEKVVNIASIQGDVVAEEFHDLDRGRQVINNRLRYVQRNDHSNNIWVELQDSKGKSSSRALNNFSNIKAHKYDVDNQRVAFGADTLIEDWTVGVMGAINNKDIDANNHGSAKVDNYQFGIYAGKSIDNINLRFSGALGRNEVETTYYDLDDGRYKAKYHGRTYQVNTEVGYAFKLDDLHFEPYVGLSYDYVKNNKFSQQNGQVSLAGDETSYDRFSSQLGLDVSKKWKFSDTTNISLNGGLAWQHSFKDINDGAKLTLISNNGAIAGYAGYIDVPFSKDSAIVNIGVSSDIKNTHEFFINYEGNFAEKYSENGVVFKYNYKF